MGNGPKTLPLHVKNLHFSVGDLEILRGVNLTLNAGSPTAVIGPNGAGKSVLLRLLHGLLVPDKGSVSWAVSTREARQCQAMVFQRPVMLRRSVLANTVFPLRLIGLNRSESRSRALTALEKSGLIGLVNRPARKLSGGEQQRLALARAWALEPEVLFLDEPTASLDPSATRAVETLVTGISSAGTKVVMTTHDLSQAKRLAGDVVFLHAGRVLEHISAEQFFASPTTREGAAFLRGDLLI